MLQPERGRKRGAQLRNQALLFNRLLLEDIYPENLARSGHPLRIAIAKDLGKSMDGPLYAAPGFAELVKALGIQASGDKLSGRALRRFNRLLLENAFPEIAKNRVGEVGSVNPYYVIIFLFVLVFSLGESMYSPRLYEYAAAVAPRGQEASYMSLSYLPFFLAKLLVGTFSGVLLGQFCPATGPRNSPMLWLVIALITTVAPVGLISLRKYIRVHEAGRDESGAG
jgi:hypothetical protein